MKNRILLVEDDENLGYILSEYLAMNELDVTLSKDGEQVLADFKKNIFDLCVLDVMMPKKDGFTLAEEIRSLDSEVPIVFLTAKALKVDKLTGFRLGADDYIVKPVDEEEFLARINAILNRTAKKESMVKIESIYDIGSYVFDPENQILKKGKLVYELTTKEAAILKALKEDLF